MECLSSSLVTINTEMISFNIRLSIVTKLNHETQEQWYLVPMLVYDSFIHELCPRSLWFQNTNWYKKFRLLAMILALICFVYLSVDSYSCKKRLGNVYKVKTKTRFFALINANQNQAVLGHFSKLFIYHRPTVLRVVTVMSFRHSP